MPNRRAFTLIELLVTISIIVILAGMLMPALVGMGKQSEVNATKSNLRQVETMCEMFKQDIGEYPLTSNSAGWANDFSSGAPAVDLNRMLVKALEVGGYFKDDSAARSALTSRKFFNGNAESAVAGASNYEADRVFIDTWKRPLIYLHLEADDPTGDWSTPTGFKGLTTPETAKDSRSWSNAFGRGSRRQAVAPAWPDMDYPGSGDEQTRGRDRRRALSEHFELWSAGLDGVFTAGVPDNEDDIAKSFHDKTLDANKDNVSLSRPWEDTGAMPWEQ